MASSNKLLYFLIFLYLSIIATSSLVSIPFKVKIPNGDKLIHLLIYLPLGFLLSLPKISSRAVFNFLIPFGFGSIYGALLEVLQSFVPGRSSSWLDELANMAGIGLGLMIGSWAKKIFYLLSRR